jgi:NAD(P)-binding Rossmann-like domain
MLTTDYLIVGSGAVGMTFADQLLTETDADMIIVDRHHMPGGHWNDAYSFVRLHQPSAFYGVGSRQLGTDRLDQSGLNKGYYELASGAEIVSYFDKLMNERFLPSGRVQYFPMCDYQGGGVFVSRLSGEPWQVAYRKRLVFANFLDTQVPSTHTTSFEVAEGVDLMTPSQLPVSAPGRQRYVILGGGKTAMDVYLFLASISLARGLG